MRPPESPTFRSATARRLAEQRNAPRRAARGAVFCRITTGSRRGVLRGEVVDVSATGIGLILPSPVPVACTIELGFVSERNAQIRHSGLVRHVSTAEADSHYRVGCEFLRPLSDEHVAIIVAELLVADEVDSRPGDAPFSATPAIPGEGDSIRESGSPAGRNGHASS